MDVARSWKRCDNEEFFKICRFHHQTLPPFFLYCVIFSPAHRRRRFLSFFILFALCVFTFLFYKHFYYYFSASPKFFPHLLHSSFSYLPFLFAVQLAVDCLQFRLFCCFYSVDFVYIWHYTEKFFLFIICVMLEYLCMCVTFVCFLKMYLGGFSVFFLLLILGEERKRSRNWKICGDLRYLMCSSNIWSISFSLCSN